jgi:hypothetical protein
MAKDENELKQNIQVAGRVLAPQTEQVDLRMEEPGCDSTARSREPKDREAVSST